MPIYKTKNENFFKIWSQNMAYVLGFIAADGTLIQNKRGGHFLEIQITDGELLGNIRDTLGSNHKISTRKQLPGQKLIHRLQIGSKVIFRDLCMRGITQKKSKTIQLPKIPQQYFSHFVRGYFDGDGNVWTGTVHKDRKTSTRTLRVVFTSGSKEFLSQLKNLLKKKILISGQLSYYSRAYRLVYSVTPALRLHKFMYNNAGIYLPRKRQIFERYTGTQ